MKKLVLIALALTTVWMSAASAQEMAAAKEKKGSLYIGGGVGMPMAPDGFSDNWSMGFGGGVGVGYYFSPMIEGVAWFDYSTYALDIPSGSTLDGADFTSMEFMADVKFIFNTKNAAAKLKPYLVVGVGTASIEISDLTDADSLLVPEASESAFALRGGAGLEYWASPKVAIFLDGKYTTVSTEGESTGYLPFRVGAKIPIF